MMFLTQAKSATVGAIMIQLIVIVSASQTTEPTNKVEGQVSNQNETIATNGRSMEQQQPSEMSGEKREQRGRSGRMLDLDHLVGAINKDEKTAKERSLNGNRQSRTLGEDIQLISGTAPPTTKGEARSPKRQGKKTGKKKMAIKGFIPIVSMEGHKGGLEDIEGGASDEDEDEESNSSQQAGSTSPDQLLAGYGGQTSMGHASFVTGETSPQQQWQNLNQGGTQSQDQQPDAAARARKLQLLGGNSNLAGSLLGGPKRLISNLVPGQHQQYPFAAASGHSQMLQGPMNIPAEYQQQQQHQSSMMLSGECICVPFFQCRNGYLTPSQLSKSQLQQISAASVAPPLVMPMHQQHHQMHQVPRALKGANDLYYAQGGHQVHHQQQQQYDAQAAMQQAAAGASLSPSQPDDQQTLNDAYEQLKKTMESENIEQLLLQQQQQQQQMMNLPLLDERSKSGGQQQQSVNGSTEDTQERSLLNPLMAGRRSGQPQKSCGIMRICCKIPPNLVSGGYTRGPQAPRLLQQQDFQQAQQQQQFISKAQQFYPNIRPAQQSFQAQQMGADFVQPATSAPMPSVHSQFQQQQQQQLVSRPVQQHPVGSFMAGRCGTRQALGVAGRVQNVQPAPGSETTAEFGEFPSHAAILKRLSPGDSLFVCSAVLISNQWLATAAHCIKRHRPEELKVRLGEWDVQRDDEFYPLVELNVREIIVHPDFQPSSLINDLALLRLDSAGLDPQQMPHIAPACLATPEQVFAGSRCWLTGWGKDAFGQAGAFQSILKKVDLPVMERQQCESALKYQTKLGKFFRLHQSALCAGGERGKDACEGDGGSGLYCMDAETGLTKVVGLVSWGVGCGQVGVPGVYTNLGLFYSWIESVIGASGEENLYMDRQAAAGGNSIPDNVFKSLVSERSNHQTSNGTATPPPLTEMGSNSTANLQQPIPAGVEVEELESRAGRRR